MSVLIKIGIFGMCVMSGIALAMSAQQKAAFRQQLTTATTAQQMQQQITGQLQTGQMIKLEISDSPVHPVAFFACTNDPSLNSLKFQDVRTIVQEVFFEDMAPLFVEGADTKVLLARFERYAWANVHVVSELQNVFADTKDSEKFQYIKNKVAHVIAARSSRPWIPMAGYIAGGVVLAAALIGALWYWQKEMPEEQESTLHENIDSVQRVAR